MMFLRKITIKFIKLNNKKYFEGQKKHPMSQNSMKFDDLT